MKLNLDIKVPSKPEWVEAVMNDFPAFLIDHADCERKASSMAMSFVAKYPDRTEIIPELIEIGIEELEHFQQVYQLMEKRDIQLPPSVLEIANSNLPLLIHKYIQPFASGQHQRVLGVCPDVDRLGLVGDVADTPTIADQ